jgi:hypothetical protein
MSRYCSQEVIALERVEPGSAVGPHRRRSRDVAEQGDLIEEVTQQATTNDQDENREDGRR